MNGMMVKLGGGDSEYPEFYHEMEEKPNFKVGEEVPATVKVKSIKEMDMDGKRVWCYEACVTSIAGEEQESEPTEDEMDEDELLEKKMDAAVEEDIEKKKTDEEEEE